ncbi:MAG: DUF1211 domain-containing protein, partial [Mucilaginibacter polytrichastri]|nr:DUF1211 domain-containing protein [Mucilaginibacter polytrichastri]
MMEETPDKKSLRNEIAKEFQVERLILFSDAVFAIVITLVAIEIRMPESDENLSADEWWQQFKHLFPLLIAYLVSFLIIGNTWYRHLKLFGFVKTFDKGLVVRNLLMLFFIGLFPFSISIITAGKVLYGPYFVYILLVLLGNIAQYVLQYYVLVQRPDLRNNLPIGDALNDMRRSRFMLICMVVLSSFTVVTFLLISVEEMKPIAFWWMMLMPVMRRFYRPKKALPVLPAETSDENLPAKE